MSKIKIGFSRSRFVNKENFFLYKNFSFEINFIAGFWFYLAFEMHSVDKMTNYCQNLSLTFHLVFSVSEQDLQ